jgi:uncharacterized ParB-like nuclease family protein
MMAATVTMNAPATEKWLQGHGLDFAMKEVHLTEIDRDASHRNQARVGAPVNDDTVILYATAMEKGDEFPAAVLYQRKDGKYIVIDGNHRIAAADLKGAKSYPGYVIENPSDVQVRMLTYEANTKHGLPTSLDERVQQAVHLVNLGSKPEEAARMLGVPASRLGSALRVTKADQRAAELNVNKRWTSLPKTMRIRLDTIQNDNVFHALTELVMTTGVKTQEMDKIVPRIRAKRTEQDMMAIVAEEYQRRKEEVRVTAGNRFGLPPRIQSLVAASRSIVRVDVDTVLKAEIGADLKARVRVQLLEASRRLEEIADALQNRSARK